MLLAELQKIIEIDNQISQLHKDLTELYNQRAALLTSDVSVPQTALPQLTTLPIDTASMARNKYALLEAAWARYSIKIPAFEKLEAKINKALDIIAEIEAAKPELHSKMELLLVPPAKQLPFPAPEALRKLQNSLFSTDYIDESLKDRTKGKKDWRLLVVYAEAEGLYLGSPRVILDGRHYIIAGHDMRDLGMVEYSALTLSSPSVIDERTWTMLYKDVKGKDLIPCAIFNGNRYRFETDEINSVFGDDRFRPAKEIS